MKRHKKKQILIRGFLPDHRLTVYEDCPQVILEVTSYEGKKTEHLFGFSGEKTEDGLEIWVKKGEVDAGTSPSL